MSNVMGERARARSMSEAAVARAVELSDKANAIGLYQASCFAPAPGDLDHFLRVRSLRDQILVDPLLAWRLPELDRLQDELDEIPLFEKWTDHFRNTVVTEGKNAFLTHALKGSSYTASQVLGLIEDTGYSAISASNTAASITAVGGGSPANGWNEAPSSTLATRGTPSFGTASSGSLALSSAVSLSIIATDTIKGAFMLMRSAAGTAPTTTVGNTSGAILSAGLFSGGDRAVANGDTLSVSYSLSV
jgi:hypothetical protein